MSADKYEIVLVKRPPEEGPFRRADDEQLVTPVFEVDGNCREIVVNKRAPLNEVIGELKQSGYPRTNGIMGMDFDEGIESQRFRIFNTDNRGIYDLVPVGELGTEINRRIKILAIDDRGGEAVIGIKPGLDDTKMVYALENILRRRIEGISQDKECHADGRPSRFWIKVDGTVAVMTRLG